MPLCSVSGNENQCGDRLAATPDVEEEAKTSRPGSLAAEAEQYMRLEPIAT